LFHVIISHFCFNTTSVHLISSHSQLYRLKFEVSKGQFLKNKKPPFIHYIQKISISNAILLTVKLSIHQSTVSQFFCFFFKY